MADERAYFATTNAPKSLGDVVTVRPDRRLSDNPEEVSTAWSEIRNSMLRRNPRIDFVLTGILTDVAYREDPATKQPVYYAVVTYKDEVLVNILVEHLGIRLSQKPGDTEDSKKRRMYEVATHMIGAHIDFVVTALDDTRVVGSRIDALNELQKRFYVNTNLEGKTVVRDGRIVEGRIMRVFNDALLVNYAGYDKRVPLRMVDPVWRADAHTRHHVGGYILSKAVSVNTGENGIELKVSYVDELDKPIIRQAGDRCIGTVTAYDSEKGTYFIRLGGEIGTNAVANSKTCIAIPKIGGKVRFVVRGMNMDRKPATAYGYIYDVI